MPARFAVIYYSVYGHVKTIATEIQGAIKKANPEASVDLFQIQETLPAEVLAAIHAPPKDESVPTLKVEQLKDYDGFAIGFPTRYGRAPSQVSALFDSTGPLWFSQALVGKFATVFTSSATQHGGQESTAITTYPFFAHHGISVVSPGFQAHELNDTDEIVGGSAYGAAAIAGKGTRQVTEKEKSVARKQGEFFAKIVSAYIKGSA